MILGNEDGGGLPAPVDVVKAICEDLFDVETVDVQATFVEMGGNSLAAVMFARRLQSAFGFRPSMQLLFSCTLADIAEICDHQSTSSGD